MSLTKLFVQPFMSKFTGFDQTMDASVVLLVIGEAAPFSGASAHAKAVRSDIRNEWAHCNFANWTEAKFEAAFQIMENLLKNVNLSTEEEQKLCDELNDWKDKGNFLMISRVLVENLNENSILFNNVILSILDFLIQNFAGH